jgi:5'-methylthioinosine phosphorylase
MMTLAIIGGSGLTNIPTLEIIDIQTLNTPFGSPSADYVIGKLQGQKIIFLSRHGNPHRIAPHHINYRANIWGLKSLGVTQIIAVAAVGGITAAMAPAHLVIPDQIIDYSYGREHTFFAEPHDIVQHIDFTYPYTPRLRAALLNAAAQCHLSVSPIATYGCTQGPRLETAAEIERMERDGCDIVGMTGMPEAVLARELNLDYATLAVVANWAAGKADGEITMADIERHLTKGMAQAMTLLATFIAV